MLDQSEIEMNRKEQLLHTMIVKLEEKVLYHEQFIKEIKQDMALLIKMVKKIIK